MAKEIKDYQLVEVYDQGVWNTVWKKKKITHDPRTPKVMLKSILNDSKKRK